ncbi:MAG: hypothetical protein COV59_02725 [Candidatus Magasanikbacteria bacterium CG11_big_fil_rev_8_21_14_0_20_39_34]|uniref:DUF2231 domain-containing protein n=1 Tax=Candidatus Magasanikbacteria bacterium CG11_big_fil_rev_8_21_14_0_20_39_34 TaxID=1974653 RepID=A0A2H0N5A3_9BACT|nr:MAG: hypothetical protein COV59_02725 [Candidatus Magasanikbacteria bacterium CG11_big_fil_rev_8_21_14_0_20_39_34]
MLSAFGSMHPAIVHLPIGILTLYSLLEIVSLNKKLKNPFVKHLKIFLSVIGVLFALPAYFAGNILEETRYGDPILEYHDTFASATLTLYAIIAVAYLLPIIFQLPMLQSVQFLKTKPIQAFYKFSQFLLQPMIIVPLSLLTLILLTITGALGGAMAHGPSADPVVAYIYHIFFTQ